ncbi:MAG: hypothetical protein ACRDQA_31380, partial [Nocardioidaceae bacterium]
MSRSNYLAALALLTTVVCAACSDSSSTTTVADSASPPSTPPSTSPPTQAAKKPARTQPSGRRIDGCTRPRHSRVVHVHAEAMPLDVLLVGRSRHGRAVVLSNQSNLDLCSWLPCARKLTQRGFTVALYDPIDPVGDLSAITTYLRKHQLPHVGLMG